MFKNQLSGIGKEPTISDSSYKAFKQYFQYFLAAALFLLIVEFFISERKRVNKKVAATLIIFLFISSASFAQNAKNEIIKGNEAYKKNNYNSAENSYRDALKIADNNPTASFNLGNTLYRKDNTDEAVEAFDNTIKNSSDNVTKENAYYNKGVAYQKAKKLPECIDAYKNALMLNPNDEDARQNLERALKLQQQHSNSSNKIRKTKSNNLNQIKKNKINKISRINKNKIMSQNPGHQKCQNKMQKKS